MITGVVTEELLAIVRIKLRANDGTMVPVDAAIDTGFTEFLTLPKDVIAALGWQPVDMAIATLAGGQRVQLPVCLGVVEWDGTPLVGMALLESFRLEMDVVSGGSVQLTRLTV